MSKQNGHTTVLLEETVAPLQGVRAEWFADLTMGGGGHLELLLRAQPQAKILGLDRDLEAIERVAKRFATEVAEGRLVLKHSAFGDLPQVLKDLGIKALGGLIADLGFSSYQVDSSERGFSFRFDGPLDMRMDQSRGRSAADLLATADSSELERIFRDYGEEKFARRIAQAIVERRISAPIKTTAALADLIKGCYPGALRHGRIHPATKVFQALRIAVNEELSQLEALLKAIPELLAIGGVASIISFHSLEDRAVKLRFRELTADCICPLTVMTCERCHNPPGHLFHRRQVSPSAAEVSSNPRARSARLRVFVRDR